MRKGRHQNKDDSCTCLSGTEIIEIINNKKAKFLEAVNFNSPSQTVISGNTDEIEAIKNDLEKAGAKRVIDLSVSVPSHSSNGYSIN